MNKQQLYSECCHQVKRSSRQITRHRCPSAQVLLCLMNLAQERFIESKDTMASLTKYPATAMKKISPVDNVLVMMTEALREAPNGAPGKCRCVLYFPDKGTVNGLLTVWSYEKQRPGLGRCNNIPILLKMTTIGRKCWDGVDRTG